MTSSEVEASQNESKALDNERQLKQAMEPSLAEHQQRYSDGNGSPM